MQGIVISFQITSDCRYSAAWWYTHCHHLYEHTLLACLIVCLVESSMLWLSTGLPTCTTVWTDLCASWHYRWRAEYIDLAGWLFSVDYKYLSTHATVAQWRRIWWQNRSSKLTNTWCSSTHCTLPSFLEHWWSSARSSMPWYKCVSGGSTVLTAFQHRTEIHDL